MEGHAFELKYDLIVSRLIDRECAFHFGLRDAHLRTALSDMVNSLSYGSAVFLAAFAGFSVRRHNYHVAKETPARYRAFLLFGSSQRLLFRLHGSLLKPQLDSSRPASMNLARLGRDVS